MRSPWRPPALLLRAVGYVLLGEHKDADAGLRAAAEAASAQGAIDSLVVALCERAMLAERAGDSRAEELAEESRRLLDGGLLARHASTAIELASSARSLLRRDAPPTSAP